MNAFKRSPLHFSYSNFVFGSTKLTADAESSTSFSALGRPLGLTAVFWVSSSQKYFFLGSRGNEECGTEEGFIRGLKLLQQNIESNRRRITPTKAPGSQGWVYWISIRLREHSLTKQINMRTPRARYTNRKQPEYVMFRLPTTVTITFRLNRVQTLDPGTEGKKAKKWYGTNDNQLLSNSDCIELSKEGAW